MVECGVWKGGNLILLENLMYEFNKFDRKILGFDTFEGMTEPNEFDINLKNQEAKLLNIEKLKTMLKKITGVFLAMIQFLKILQKIQNQII